MELALEAGADDVVLGGEVFEITCSVADFTNVKGALAAKKIPTESGKILMLPKNTMLVEDAQKASQVLHFVDLLEENDDVQNVYTNCDIPDNLVEQG